MPSLLPVSLLLLLKITYHNLASIQPENNKDKKLDTTGSSKAEFFLNICDLTSRWLIFNVWALGHGSKTSRSEKQAITYDMNGTF